jgi:hypothetical protein
MSRLPFIRLLLLGGWTRGTLLRARRARRCYSGVT